MASVLDDLNSGGKHAVTHDDHLMIKLPSAAKALITKAAAEEGVSRATVVRRAIADYLQRTGYAK